MRITLVWRQGLTVVGAGLPAIGNGLSRASPHTPPVSTGSSAIDRLAVAFDARPQGVSSRMSNWPRRASCRCARRPSLVGRAPRRDFTAFREGIKPDGSSQRSGPHVPCHAQAPHSFSGRRPCQDGTSHAIFKTPWPGDPRVNIQDNKGKAKVYQVRRVLMAIEKLESKHGH